MRVNRQVVVKRIKDMLKGIAPQQGRNYRAELRGRRKALRQDIRYYRNRLKDVKRLLTLSDVKLMDAEFRGHSAYFSSYVSPKNRDEKALQEILEILTMSTDTEVSTTELNRAVGRNVLPRILVV